MATSGKQQNSTNPIKKVKDATIVNSTTPSERLIKEIRRNTRKIFSAEEKVLIVMEGIR